MSEGLETKTWVRHELVTPLMRETAAIDLDAYFKEREIKYLQGTGRVPIEASAMVCWSFQGEFYHADYDYTEPAMWLARISVEVL